MLGLSARLLKRTPSNAARTSDEACLHFTRHLDSLTVSWRRSVGSFLDCFAAVRIVSLCHRRVRLDQAELFRRPNRIQVRVTVGPDQPKWVMFLVQRLCLLVVLYCFVSKIDQVQADKLRTRKHKRSFVRATIFSLMATNWFSGWLILSLFLRAIWDSGPVKKCRFRSNQFAFIQRVHVVAARLDPTKLAKLQSKKIGTPEGGVFLRGIVVQ